MTQVSIIADLSDNQAEALAQLVKRFSYDDAARLSRRNDDGGERDAMIAAVEALARALASAGFEPR